MWRALLPWPRCIGAQLRSAATCSALLQGKSLEQIERRIARLTAFQSRLLWPATTSFEAFGRSYPVPVTASPPAGNSATLQRLQYLAGFFDGDGCVQQKYLQVVQSANNAAILWTFRKTFGGGIYRHGEGRGLQQPTLVWKAGGDWGKLAAAQLLDHSFVKHAQLKVMSSLSSSIHAQRAAHVLSKLKGLDSYEDVACSWAYVTGFFDAEGHISIPPSQAGARLQIVQKHSNVLVWIQRFLKTELGCEPPLYQTNHGHHCLALYARDQVQVVLQQFLENGLLVKRAQAAAALQADRKSHAILRALSFPGRGNQNRYRRLDAAGDERAKQIRSLCRRLCSPLLSRQDTDVLREQLADLKKVHAYLHASTIHRTIQIDIRRLLAQGAFFIEASPDKQNGGMRQADLFHRHVYSFGSGHLWLFNCGVDDR